MKTSKKQGVDGKTLDTQSKDVDTQNESNPEEKFSESYFKKETINLRNLMGDRNFWKMPMDKRNRALFAYQHLYFNLELEVAAKMSDVFMSTCNEYHQREVMMIAQLEVNQEISEML